MTFSSLLRWAVGAPWLVFTASALIVTSWFMPMRQARPLAQALFKVLLAIAGIKLVVRGREHLDPARGYLYMSNHINLFEPFIMGIVAPGWIVGIEKIENFKLPFYGQLIKAWGNVPIDRKDTRSAIETLKRAQALLAEGVSLQIMPEGTRTRDGALGPFKKGGFHTAIDAGAAIVPFAFRGLWEVNRTGSLIVKPGVVEVVFTPPIEAGAYSKDELPALMEAVRGRIVGAMAGIEAPSSAADAVSSEGVDVS